MLFSGRLLVLLDLFWIGFYLLECFLRMARFILLSGCVFSLSFLSCCTTIIPHFLDSVNGFFLPFKWGIIGGREGWLCPDRRRFSQGFGDVLPGGLAFVVGSGLVAGELVLYGFCLC